MRAFIEYPDVSDDRIEIKKEFVVETRAHRYRNSVEAMVERGKYPPVMYDSNGTVSVSDLSRYWKDER